MNSQIFNIGNNFTIRFPNRSINKLLEDFNKSKYTQFDEINWIQKIMEDQGFVENIKTASPSLYESLLNYNNKNKKDINNIFQSLFKYYVRFHSRPTPFSRFSSVALGSFEGSTKSTIVSEKVQKKVRISEEWLNEYINYLEKNLDLLTLLELKTNELLEEDYDLYYLPYYTGGDVKDYTSIKEVQLNRTDLLVYTLNYFRSGAKVSGYLKTLEDKGVDTKTANNYISSLLQKEFLISSLRISNSTNNKVLELIKVLESLGVTSSVYKNFLEKIISYIEDEKNNDYTIIEKEMSSVVNSKEYIQIDSIYSEELNFSNELKLELKSYAELLYRLGILFDAKDNAMEYYLNKFMDHYGINIGIPLKTLINDKSELGPPPTYTNPAGVLDYEYYNSKHVNQRSDNQFFSELIYRLNTINNVEIDIKTLVDKYINKEMPIKEGSADIYVSVYQDGDKFRIYPSGNIFSPFAGRTAGRFLYGLPHKQVEQFIDEQKEQITYINPNLELVNVNINPFIPRSSNVMKAKTHCDYELTINSYNNEEKKKINLDDVFVYTDGQNFKFYSKELGKEMRFSISHMLNHRLNSPNIYRFILDVEMFRNFPTYQFDWGMFDDKPVLPLVRYGNYIIKAKTWNLNIEDKNMDLNKYLDDFKVRYQVSRFVKIVDFDNFILIDLENKSNIDILLKMLKKERKLKLEDADELLYESILKDSNGNHYINEIVYSIYVQNNSNKSAKEQVTLYDPLIYKQSEAKNWYYLKLYHPLGKDGKIISQNLKDLAKNLTSKGQFFYIKYADPKPHIRLRIKYEEKSKLLVQDVLKDFIETLYEQKRIYDVVSTKYNRELDRYGGPKRIEYAENVFITDSLFTLNISPLINRSEYKSIFLVYTCVELLKSFLENEQIYNWLEKNYVFDKKYYKEFRKEIKEVEQKNPQVGNSLLMLMESNIGENWRISLGDYREQIKDQDNFDNYVLSILHMHLNRLGIHNIEENKMMNLIYLYVKERSYKSSTPNKIAKKGEEVIV